MLELGWELADVAPRVAAVDTGYAWGRFRTPIALPNVGVGASRFRLKKWCYASVVTPRTFFAFAIVQLGYVGQLFAYVVDRGSGQRRELTRASPLGRAVRFSPSSVDGVTRFSTRQCHLSVTHDQTDLRVSLDLVLEGERLRGDLSLHHDQTLALLFPLADDRAAYTHKAAGMRAEGTLWLGGRRLSFDDGLAALDWTCSEADRHTRWNWASFSGRSRDGRRLGLNLSAHVYDRASGSLENALWVDGVVHALDGVRFRVPKRTTDAWHIASLHGEEVSLTFRPLGERRSNLDLGLVRSVFTQPYGEVMGSVRGESFDGLFGVVEDHDALW